MSDCKHVRQQGCTAVSTSDSKYVLQYHFKDVATKTNDNTRPYLTSTGGQRPTPILNRRPTTSQLCRTYMQSNMHNRSNNLVKSNDNIFRNSR